MAELLATLELEISQTTGTSARIRSQVTSIDEYMIDQRRRETHSHQITEQSQQEVRPPASLNQGPYQTSCEGYGDIGNGPSCFQLPPEILDGFKWTFDAPMGLHHGFIS